MIILTIQSDRKLVRVTAAELSCNFQISTWFDHYCLIKSNVNIFKIGLCAFCPFSKWFLWHKVVHAAKQTISVKWSVWTLIARSMGPTWGPSGADRTQVDPMLAPWTLLSGEYWRQIACEFHAQYCASLYDISSMRFTFHRLIFEGYVLGVYWKRQQ